MESTKKKYYFAGLLVRWCLASASPAIIVWAIFSINIICVNILGDHLMGCIWVQSLFAASLRVDAVIALHVQAQIRNYTLYLQGRREIYIWRRSRFFFHLLFFSYLFIIHNLLMFGKVHDDTLSVHDSTFVIQQQHHSFVVFVMVIFGMHGRAPYPLSICRFSRFYSCLHLFFFWQCERRNYFT